MRTKEYWRDSCDFVSRSEWFRNGSLLLLAAIVGIELAFTFGHSFEWAVVVAMACFLLGQLSWQIFKTYKKLQKENLAVLASREIRSPDRLAEDRVKQSAEPYLIVGAAVETI